MPTPTAQVFDAANVTFQYTEVVPQFNFPVIRRPVWLTASTNYPAGSLIGEVTATPGVYNLWAHASSDGSQNWTAILPREVTTDANGNIYYAHTAVSETNYSEQATQAYFAGSFLISDLPGWTSNSAGDNAASQVFDAGKFVKF